MTERAVCEVPGCTNSSARFAGSEYLCSRHWRMVPGRLKRRRTRIVRLLTKRGRLLTTTTHYLPQDDAAHRLLWSLWRRMVTAAIEGAAGI